MTERMGSEPHIIKGKPLSPREREVLFYSALDLPNKQIADKMRIAYQTVKNHKTNIYVKLDIFGVAGAIALLMATDQGFYDEVKRSLLDGAE